MMAEKLTHEEFSRHLNTMFRIRLDEATAFDAELVDISEHMVSARQERFAIVFRTANDFLLSQGLASFEHDQMGTFQLFIVPIGRDEEGTSYEAVFNRLVKKK